MLVRCTRGHQGHVLILSLEAPKGLWSCPLDLVALPWLYLIDGRMCSRSEGGWGVPAGPRRRDGNGGGEPSWDFFGLAGLGIVLSLCTLWGHAGIGGFGGNFMFYTYASNMLNIRRGRQWAFLSSADVYSCRCCLTNMFSSTVFALANLGQNFAVHLGVFFQRKIDSVTSCFGFVVLAFRDL